MKLKSKSIGVLAAVALGWSVAARAEPDWGSVYYGVSMAQAEAVEYCWGDPYPATCQFYRRQYWAGNFFAQAYMYPEYSTERDTLLMIAIYLSSSS